MAPLPALEVADQHYNVDLKVLIYKRLVDTAVVSEI
jgi:hypothetical protein